MSRRESGPEVVTASAALSDVDTMSDLQELAAVSCELYFGIPSKYKICFSQSGASMSKTLETHSAMALPLFCCPKALF